MQTLKIGAASYKLSPMRDIGALRAKLAKCDGKYKPTKIKADTRKYPAFTVGMSTSEYVALFATLNEKCCLIDESFFATLNEDPCTLYTGEDTEETIEDQFDIVIPTLASWLDQPQQRSMQC
jgi:hypothetical protein